MAPAPIQRLETTVVSQGGREVLAVAGELDLACTDRFLSASRERLAAGRLDLDLGGLTFIDSSGVRALDALLRDAERAGATLTIVRVHPQALAVLQMTGIADLLTFEEHRP
ncbi:MAG TPA: STAS domain-containing protein [Capillimicrobium sp.]